MVFAVPSLTVTWPSVRSSQESMPGSVTRMRRAEFVGRVPMGVDAAGVPGRPSSISVTEMNM
jgi:hypothetical protein